jgi:hypothetical protein
MDRSSVGCTAPRDGIVEATLERRHAGRPALTTCMPTSIPLFHCLCWWAVPGMERWTGRRWTWKPIIQQPASVRHCDMTPFILSSCFEIHTKETRLVSIYLIIILLLFLPQAIYLDQRPTRVQQSTLSTGVSTPYMESMEYGRLIEIKLVDIYTFKIVH